MLNLSEELHKCTSLLIVSTLHKDFTCGVQSWLEFMESHWIQQCYVFGDYHANAGDAGFWYNTVDVNTQIWERWKNKTKTKGKLL